MGLVGLRHVGSSQTRARTRVPCIGRQILNHCTTGEAPKYYLLIGPCVGELIKTAYKVLFSIVDGNGKWYVLGELGNVMDGRFVFLRHLNTETLPPAPPPLPCWY